MVSSKLRRHKVMEKAIRKVFGNNLPPRFKFKDTYDSIEVPTEYQAQLVSVQTELEQEFEAMMEEEEALPTVTMDIEDLDIISTNVYSNTTTGRIGIGTANPAGTLHVHSSDSIVVPSGTTAQRSQTPVNGMLRYNSETGYFETYTVSGWGSLATPPSIESFTPTTVVDTGTSGGGQITVTGSFFDQNSLIKLRGSDGTEYSTTNFSFTSTTSISATLPYLPGIPKSPYTVVVTAGSGLSAESTDTLVSGNTPVWSSPAAGANLSSSSTITLSATDADGDTLTYSIVSGTLPSGLTLSGNTISGTSTATAGSTSTITVRASDGDLYADRTFNIETPLYAFTSHTFTNAGQTGRTGPTLTQCRNAYNVTWDGDTSLFNVVTQGIQEWTVPETGTYRIEIAGAAGGVPYDTLDNTGFGAILIFDVNLNINDVICIVVGQRGTPIDLTQAASPGFRYNSGGGGGTFVYHKISSTPIAVAGGGGGGSYISSLRANAGITTNGHPGTGVDADGTNTFSGLLTGQTNGYGGINNSATNYKAGGGGGWYGNGGGGHGLCTYTVSPGNGKPSNFIGGEGGNVQGGANGEDGGFGGGGGGTGRCGSCQSGGGGGYTGGGTASSTTNPTHESLAGGGSYLDSSQTTFTSINLSTTLSNGYAIITLT